jgi:molybdopterin-guanine dinucleotide biosynthesis protein A
VAEPLISAWILAGGEGRRMGGRDKGLVPFQGRPLVAHVLSTLRPQVDDVWVIANRHLADYARELARHPGDGPEPARVLADDLDLPAHSGPLAGVVTALRHARTPWLFVSPCDTPHLPADLVSQLLATALREDADVVVPTTMEPNGQTRHHWLCAVVNKRVCPETEAVFVTGERKIGQWVRSLRWRAVCFPESRPFMNINTLETSDGRD